MLEKREKKQTEIVERCSCCGEIKPIYELVIKARYNDELELWCKSCIKKYCQDYYEAHIKTIDKITREWYRKRNSERLSKIVQKSNRKDPLKSKGNKKDRIDAIFKSYLEYCENFVSDADPYSNDDLAVAIETIEGVIYE